MCACAGAFIRLCVASVIDSKVKWYGNDDDDDIFKSHSFPMKCKLVSQSVPNISEYISTIVYCKLEESAKFANYFECAMDPIK